MPSPGGAVVSAASVRARRWRKSYPNLAILHPEAPLSALKVEARDSFAAPGQAVAELAHSDAISENPERFCEFTVDPAAEVALLSDPQAPAVLITAHVAPLVLHQPLPRPGGRFSPVHPLCPGVEPGGAGGILRLRGALPVTLISRDNSMRGLLKALGKGEKVGLASDVRLDSGEPLLSVILCSPIRCLGAWLCALGVPNPHSSPAPGSWALSHSRRSPWILGRKTSP